MQRLIYKENMHKHKWTVPDGIVILAILYVKLQAMEEERLPRWIAGQISFGSRLTQDMSYIRTVAACQRRYYPVMQLFMSYALRDWERAASCGVVVWGTQWVECIHDFLSTQQGESDLSKSPMAYSICEFAQLHLQWEEEAKKEGTFRSMFFPPLDFSLFLFMWLMYGSERCFFGYMQKLDTASTQREY